MLKQESWEAEWRRVHYADISITSCPILLTGTKHKLSIYQKQRQFAAF